MASNVLPGPIALLKEAWGLFVLRWKTVLGVYLSGILLFAALAIFFVLIFGLGAVSLFALNQLNATSIVIAAVVILAVVVVMIVAGAWWQSALILSYVGSEKKLTFSECFKQAKGFIVPLILTGLLSAFIIVGGYFVFFLPGILFAIWFTFAQFVVIDQKTKNFTALQTSRELFRGRFFKVIWRMIAVYLPFIILGILFGSTGNSENAQASNSIVNLASFVVSPFLGMYSYVLYKHLKSQPVKNVSTNSKALYVGVAVVGYVLLALLASALMSVAGTAVSNYQKEMKRQQQNSVEIPQQYEIPQELDEVIDQPTI